MLNSPSWKFLVSNKTLNITGAKRFTLNSRYSSVLGGILCIAIWTEGENGSTVPWCGVFMFGAYSSSTYSMWRHDD